MENQAYTFVKNIQGSLSFELDSYNMQLPTKLFTIPYNVESIIIPYPYAMGLFISDSALNQYKLGYFTIKNYESLKAKAEELGFLPHEEIKQSYTAETIKEKLLKGDIDYIKKALDSGNPVAVANILVEAQGNLGQLSLGMINLVNDTCGVELEIE